MRRNILWNWEKRFVAINLSVTHSAAMRQITVTLFPLSPLLRRFFLSYAHTRTHTHVLNMAYDISFRLHLAHSSWLGSWRVTFSSTPLVPFPNPPPHISQRALISSTRWSSVVVRVNGSHLIKNYLITFLALISGARGAPSLSLSLLVKLPRPLHSFSSLFPLLGHPRRHRALALRGLVDRPSTPSILRSQKWVKRSQSLPLNLQRDYMPQSRYQKNLWWGACAGAARKAPPLFSIPQRLRGIFFFHRELHSVTAIRKTTNLFGTLNRNTSFLPRNNIFGSSLAKFSPKTSIFEFLSF